LSNKPHIIDLLTPFINTINISNKNILNNEKKEKTMESKNYRVYTKEFLGRKAGELIIPEEQYVGTTIEVSYDNKLVVTIDFLANKYELCTHRIFEVKLTKKELKSPTAFNRKVDKLIEKITPKIYLNKKEI
jgi:hypothetical protein